MTQPEAASWHMVRMFIAIALFTFSAEPTEEAAVIANKGLEIPEDQIQATKDEALGGSGMAAFKLFDYYEIVSVDRAKSLYWATIAAENDYSSGMYALGFKLAKETDRARKIRAKYWLENAKKNGEPLADDILKDLDRSKP